MKRVAPAVHALSFLPRYTSARKSLFLAALCLLGIPVIDHLPWANAGEAGFPVRIAGVDYLGDMPTLVAFKNNIFREHGIDVRVDYGESGKENLGRLRSGEIDFAMMALTPLVIDALADPSPAGPDDPVILASVVHSTELNHVVTVSGKDINAPHDLAGRRVALSRGTNAELVWWLFAEYHGLDPRSVQLVDQTPREILQTLTRGEVDAGVIWEPWTTRLRLQIGAGLHEFPGSNIYTAKWVIVATRRQCQDHAAQCRAVLAAYRDAIDAIERNPRAAIREYADFAGIDESTPILEKQVPDFQPGLDWSLINTLQQQFAWARSAGYGNPDREPAILSLIEATPLRTIAPNAVRIPQL